LKAMSEHRAVRFREDVVRDDDPEVGLDPKEISVERRVVEFAQADSVRDARLAVGIGVRDDMRGIEEFGVLEVADGAVFSVGAEDAFAKGLLVEALASRDEAIAAREIGFCHAVGEGQPARNPIDVETELEPGRIVAGDVDRPCGDVSSGNCCVEVDERGLGTHGVADPTVVDVIRVRAPVFINHGSIGLEPVVVGAWPAGSGSDGRQAERTVAQDRGFEDALGADQADLLTSEEEALFERSALEGLAVDSSVLCQELKGSGADGFIEICGHENSDLRIRSESGVLVIDPVIDLDSVD